MERSRSGKALTRVAVVLMLMTPILSATGAWALTSCKAKLNQKNGVITVNAADVSGTLRWGWKEQMEVMEFDNATTCISGSAAKNCTLGAEGSADRITPPPLCTIYLEDSAGACSSYIPGCVPGSRPICPPDTEQVGSWCIDRAATQNVEFNEAVAVCQAKGRSVCPLEAMIECDQNRAGGSYPAFSCAGVTDGTGWAWTVTPDAADGFNFFAHMTVYQSDNGANVQSTGIGSLYHAFCCQRLGGE